MADTPSQTPGARGGRSLALRALMWCLVVIWAGVIFWWSSKPGSQIPGQFSEAGHLGEYFVFGALLYLALALDMPAGRALAVAIIIASAYGITDEFHQHFVPMRTPDVVDWGSDTLGATVGAISAWAVRTAGKYRASR